MSYWAGVALAAVIVAGVVAVALIALLA